MRNSVERHFNRDGHLLLDFLRSTAWPLRNYLNVIVSNVGIRLNGQILERNNAPAEQQNSNCKHEKPVAERIVDKCTDHRSISGLLLRGARQLKCVLHDPLPWR